MPRISAVRSGFAKSLAVAGISVLALAASNPTFVQTEKREGAAANAPEETFVTARKRQESIMKTPVIMQAISQQKIKDLNIDSINAIQKAAPGLRISQAYAIQGMFVYLRGLGNGTGANFVDQSTALNIDGFTSNYGGFFRQGVMSAATSLRFSTAKASSVPDNFEAARSYHLWACT